MNRQLAIYYSVQACVYSPFPHIFKQMVAYYIHSHTAFNSMCYIHKTKAQGLNRRLIPLKGKFSLTPDANNICNLCSLLLKEQHQASHWELARNAEPQAPPEIY